MHDNTLFRQAMSLSNLLAAWEHVAQKHGRAGTDGIGVDDFAVSVEWRLARLRQRVLGGTYHPRALLAIDLPKPAGGLRRLCIPTVQDRVLQSAVARAINPTLEAAFEPCSFAYRRGRSVQKALYEVARWRDRDYTWVVDADVSAFFDQVDQHRVLAELHRLVPDYPLLALVRSWLRARVRSTDGEYCLTRGLPQGSPLSPLLANLYLDRLDEALAGARRRVVRYADDFVVLCRREQDARRALTIAGSTLDELGLELNPDKTRLTDFHHGFRFLGARFVDGLVIPSREPDLAVRAERSVPLALPAPDTKTQGTLEPATPPVHGASDGTLHTLYVTEQGAHLARDGRRLVVQKDGEELASVPSHRVDQIMVFGNIALTTPFMQHCLRAGIPIALLTRTGLLYGVIDAPDTASTDLHERQFTLAADPAARLSLARAFVAGKLGNAIVVLRRYARHRDAPALTSAAQGLVRLAGQLEHAATLETLRGYEGMAARLYFEAIAATLEPAWGFSGRARRPPPDPVNALLSFGYMLLYNTVWALLRARGVNPNVGLLHSRRAGHAALASDLMEEFRPIVVDSLVLQLLLGNRLTVSDFEIETQDNEPSCRLAPDARKRFIIGFETKMSDTLLHPPTGRRLTYRQCIAEQVRMLVGVLRGHSGSYRPLVVR